MPPSLTPAQRRARDKRAKLLKEHPELQGLPDYSTDPYVPTIANMGKPPKRPKKPPIPVPDVQADIDQRYPKAKPKPKPQMYDFDGPGGIDPNTGKPEKKKKPRPHGGHLPTQFEYMSPQDFANRALGVDTEEDRTRIRRYNQDRERERRAAAKAQAAEARARREQIRKIPKKARDMIGREKIDRFIATGSWDDGPGFGDVVKGIGGAALHGVAKLPGAIADLGSDIAAFHTEGLARGGRGQGTGKTEFEDYKLNRITQHAFDLGVGENIRKAASGEDYNPAWLAVELGLLAIPIKGLPTPLSAGLRAAVGAKRLAQMERAGMTTADVARELTTPLHEVRAMRRARLLSAAADANAAERAGAAATGPIPSSRIAGALAGKGSGPIRNWIRNDVRATRKFTVGDSTMETAADLSRTGKAVRAFLDRIRDLPGVPLRSTETLYMRKLGQHAVQKMNRAAGIEHALDAALPRGWRRNIDWPGMYAVRAVAKGHTIEESIATTQRFIDEAIEKGDKIGQKANEAHLAFFKKAAKYVKPGTTEWADDAPIELENLRRTLERVSAEREDIIGGLDLLAVEAMEARVLKEQLFYANAKRIPHNDYIEAAIKQHPVRQRLEEIWTKQHGPDEADYGLTIQDANARRVYENAVAYYDEEIDRVKAAAERHAGTVLEERHLRDVERLEAERDGLSPAMFYDQIHEVNDVLPQDVIDEISKDYGEFGKAWRFSMAEADADDFADASKRIADDILDEGLPLPEELNTPEKLQEGIANVFKLAKDGETGKDWYPIAADGVVTVSEHTGVPPKQVAQLFAIYSQAADTVANATFVFQAIREYQRYGDIFSGRFPVRQSEEAKAVLEGGTWEGRKRSSFYANILRHIPGMEEEYAATLKGMEEFRGSATNPVTVDRWVVRMFAESLGDVPGSYYDTFEKIIQKMSQSVGWEPEQVQAAAWVAMKDKGLKAEHAAAIAKGKKPRTTVRHIAGAEDAFQYGIRRQIEKELEDEAAGQLFDTAALEVTPQMKRLANQANKKWGGFTVDRDLKPVPEKGYSVTVSITETPYKLHGLKGSDIAQFRDRWAEMLKDKRYKIGGFSDDQNEVGDGTEITYLSLTRHFQRKADALKYAREQGQETVYEYKTGDGIRTGLTRDEQAAIIERLRDEAGETVARGVPLPERVVLNSKEQEYQDFLDKASKEFLYTKEGKKSTPAQRARAEQWLSDHAHEYEDEPLIQEWYEVSAKQDEVLPPWMIEEPPPAAQEYRASLNGGHQQDELFGPGGEPTKAADAILEGRGVKEAKTMPGYEGAVADLQAGVIPRDFIEAVVNSPLHIYDKMGIARHLDSIAGGGLLGRDYPDIPGAARIFHEIVQLAGLWEGETRQLYFSSEAHPVDWIHEFTHAMETAGAFPKSVQDTLWTHVGAQPGDKLTHDQSEDVADLVCAAVLGFDEAASSLPGPVKAALTHTRKAMEKSIADPKGRNFIREHEALAALPEEERQFLDDIFTYADDEGPYFTNGFTPRPGQYVPEVPGLPFGANPLHPRRTATLWARMLGGKKIKSMTHTDASLTHEWKGLLLASGRWKKSVIDGPLDGLMKAYQIERMRAIHDKLVEIGWKQPTTEYGLRDWIMVPKDPGAWTEKTRSQARGMVDILKAFDSGNAIDNVQLDRVDAQAIEQVKDYMFPGMTDDSAKRITDFVQQALSEEIEDVVWVPKPLLMRTGMFDSPMFPGIAENGISKGVVYGLDSLNNIMKMMVLSLNPAYYPMNMAGQMVMLGSQLTWSAPFSLARSLRQWKTMSAEDLALADRFAGVGFAGSTVLTEVGAFERATNAVGKVGTILIDKYPRRAAFFHEARRLGYKSDEQIHDLLNDLRNFDDLMKVHERTQRAMVDYGNLNKYEKGIATHLIFVYPWLRGSSRYAMQFPFDHPIQTAAFAGLVYWQQNRLKEAMPEGHPGYLKWYLPLDVGGEGENPYGFRMDQLATPLQTLDIAALLTYWGTGGKFALPWGSNEEGMGAMLGPLAEEIEKTITGWDSFTREEVSHGLPQMLLRILDPRERWASWNRLKKIMDHETHKGLYDTTQRQNWLRLFLGSLAPINVDSEKAGEQGAKQRGTPSASQRRDEYLDKIEQANGKPLTETERETIGKWKENDQVYNSVSADYRDEHDLQGDTSIQHRLAMLFLTIAELNPEKAALAQERAKMALDVSDDEAQAAYDELREALGLRQLGTLDRRVSEKLGEQTGETP